MTLIVGRAAAASSSFRRRVWPVLRWFPAVGLASLGALAWSAFLSGSAATLYAYAALAAVLPALAVLALLGTLVYALIKRRASAPLWVTRLVALALLWPAAWMFGVGTMRYPGSLADAQPAATVRLPFAEPVRVYWGGDELRSNYHAAYPDQRWAYDLTVDPTLTRSARLEDYGCYGKAVLAPAAGRVQHARDGEPDGVPGDVSGALEPFGNLVSLELDSGTHLVLAHLQPGSLSVRTGDTVREGQQIARCGNSGRTSEPHLHLHHQRQPLAPGQIPEGLPLFFRDHDGPAMPSGGVRINGDLIQPVGPVLRHVGSPRAGSTASAATPKALHD